MIKLGADKIPHLREEDSLLSHSIRVAGLLYNYGRSMDEVKSGLFHSIYGTEFQRYKIHVPREEVQDVIGERSCLLYTSPSPRDRQKSRMPSSA